MIPFVCVCVFNNVHIHAKKTFGNTSRETMKCSFWDVGLRPQTGARRDEKFTITHPLPYCGNVLLCTIVLTFIIKTSSHFI